MNKEPGSSSSKEWMSVLSCLLLSPPDSSLAEQAISRVCNTGREEFSHLLALAGSNHVIVRAIEVILRRLQALGESGRAEWASLALAAERSRIDNAVEHLSAICAAFTAEGIDVTVIKSLDHWPDLGSDLDLFSNATPQAVCDLMARRFGAKLAIRSWGDRLACKWNFEIPGLPESVEVHVGRLGQTGEQLVLASSLPSRARTVEIGGQVFRVPSASDRIMISTLQRMYRHFYFRLCDIVDSAALVTSGQLDFSDLRASSQAAGIWEGVATYLTIVSDYVRHYTKTDLGLPQFVKQSARFGGSLVYFGRDFIRVPIMPHSAALYRTQLSGLIRKGELQSSARLGLLPALATAAAVGQKLTGSDKGIW